MTPPSASGGAPARNSVLPAFDADARNSRSGFAPAFLMVMNTRTGLAGVLDFDAPWMHDLETLELVRMRLRGARRQHHGGGERESPDHRGTSSNAYAMPVNDRYSTFDCIPFISLTIGTPNIAKPENAPYAMRSARREQEDVAAGV